MLFVDKIMEDGPAGKHGIIEVRRKKDIVHVSPDVIVVFSLIIV
jgi:hypothetical protein